MALHDWGNLVGWVELREPHHCLLFHLVGLAALDPPYKTAKVCS